MVITKNPIAASTDDILSKVLTSLGNKWLRQIPMKNAAKAITIVSSAKLRGRREEEFCDDELRAKVKTVWKVRPRIVLL